MGAMLYCLPGCRGDNSEDTDTSEFSEAVQWGRDSIAQAMQDTSVTAISIALMSRDKIVWQESFGLADTQAKTAVDLDTRFNIGSVSKVVAAFAAMILCDRGQLALDTPIVRYLPSFQMRSEGFRNMTLRHLLSHSSGLPGTNGRNIFAFVPIDGYAQDTFDCMPHFHLKHEPGELAVYCNDGFTMVESLVTAVTGLSYPEFVQREILQPLGMSHSAFSTRPFTAGSFVSPDFQGQPQGQEFVAAYATGGLASTPGDMMKLAALFMNQGVHQGKRILSQKAVEQMGSDQTTRLRINPCPEWRWGLGWDNTLQPGLDSVGVRAWAKNGGTAFFTTEFFVLPDEGLSLWVSGTGPYRPLPIAEGVLLRALKEKGSIRKLPDPLDTAVPRVANASGNAGLWAGIYANYITPFKVVEVDSHTLDIWQWKEGQWEILAQGLKLRTDGWWWSDSAPDVSYRWQAIDGKLYLINRVPGGSPHYRLTFSTGQRLTPSSTPMPTAWQQRMGTRWQIVNESPDSVASRMGGGIVTLGALPDLDGYILWDNEQLLWPEGNSRARMTIQLPVTHGRDLVELEMRTVNGQEELRVGTSVYRQIAS